MANAKVYKEAKSLEAIIRLLQEARNRTSQARAFNNMGFLNTQLKRFDEALSCFQNAYDLFDVLGDKFGKALQLGNIGSVYRDLDMHMLWIISRTTP